MPLALVRKNAVAKPLDKEPRAKSARNLPETNKQAGYGRALSAHVSRFRHLSQGAHEENREKQQQQTTVVITPAISSFSLVLGTVLWCVPLVVLVSVSLFVAVTIRIACVNITSVSVATAVLPS